MSDKPWEMYQDAPWNQFGETASGGDSVMSPMTKKPATLADYLRASVPSAMVRGAVLDPINAGAEMAAGALGGDAKAVGLQNRDMEQAYQQSRLNIGREGFDAARLAGSFVSPVNRAIPGGKGIMQSAAGAGLGNVLMTPTYGEGDLVSQKVQQAQEGVVGGALMRGAANVIAPPVSAGVRRLMDAGVRPTVGQMAGGALNRVEEAAMSIPGLGDVIQSGRQYANRTLNTSTINRALKPINEQLPEGTQFGREAISYAQGKLSDAYNDVLDRANVQADQPFMSNLANLKALASNGDLPPEISTQISNIIDNQVLTRFGKGVADGQNLKAIESKLGQLIKNYSSSPDVNQREIGQAMKQVNQEVRDLIYRQNPMLRKQLDAINEGYSIFKAVQKAASSVATDEGTFTGAMLQNAVKATDRSKDKAKFAAGKLKLSQLGDDARSVLGNKVADSGTPIRAMVGGGALGGSYMANILPETLLGMGLASTLYTKPVMNALPSLVRRPDAVMSLGDMVRSQGQYAIPGLLGD